MAVNGRSRAPKREKMEASNIVVEMPNETKRNERCTSSHPSNINENGKQTVREGERDGKWLCIGEKKTKRTKER